jgi:hypothetical protein
MAAFYHKTGNLASITVSELKGKKGFTFGI